MTEIELLIDFHKDAKRQGPGSSEDTLKALSFIAVENDPSLKIADIGCGTGAQTLILAQYLKGQISAVDLFPEFLEKLEARSSLLRLQDQITLVQHSMETLSFSEGEFDIIWSEGAIYIMGFEAGIKKWKAFLKPGGYLAVSEITWLSHTRPAEIDAYWQQAYPQVDTASNKLKILEQNGFSPVAYFFLPESSWMDNYYLPIEARIDDFLVRHHHSEMAQHIIEQERKEISMYKRYKDYLSYGFYIAKKL